jgi:hypothetical protein
MKIVHGFDGFKQISQIFSLKINHEFYEFTRK